MADHENKKIVVDGVEVQPAKKVKLRDHKTKEEIDALLDKKRAELSEKEDAP